MTEFGHETTIDVRYRDIDTMGHVNNAVYSTYLEQARVEYIEDVADGDSLAVGVVLADLHVEFQRPIDHGGSVVVGTRVGELGVSSLPVEHVIRADGEVAATAEALMVTYDREAAEPRPVPDSWRERIRAHEDH
jgi:acyl-CoA thioester hydrolase